MESTSKGSTRNASGKHDVSIMESTSKGSTQNARWKAWCFHHGINFKRKHTECKWKACFRHGINFKRKHTEHKVESMRFPSWNQLQKEAHGQTERLKVQATKIKSSLCFIHLQPIHIWKLALVRKPQHYEARYHRKLYAYTSEKMCRVLQRLPATPEWKNVLQSIHIRRQSNWNDSKALPLFYLIDRSSIDASETENKETTQLLSRTVLLSKPRSSVNIKEKQE